MSHRALIYNVLVHEKYKPKEEKLLGNIDGSGTYLAEYLDQALSESFAPVSHDGNRDVSCERTRLVEPDLGAVLRPGERGVRADIIGPGNQTSIFQQEKDHTQLLKCACLFRLPRNQRQGRLAIHVNHGRSVKSLLDSEITKRFREAFPDLMLKINPCVDAAAFEAAIDQDQLLSVNLYKNGRPNEIQDGRKWGRADTGLKLQLSIKAPRDKRLVPTLVKRVLQGNAAAFGEIVEFADFPYEEAKFEVLLDDGTKRSYNIHNLEAGHAMSQDIEPEDGADGYPTDESLYTELGRVLTEME